MQRSVDCIWGPNKLKKNKYDFRGELLLDGVRGNFFDGGEWPLFIFDGGGNIFDALPSPHQKKTWLWTLKMWHLKMPQLPLYRRLLPSISSRMQRIPRKMWPRCSRSVPTPWRSLSGGPKPVTPMRLPPSKDITPPLLLTWNFWVELAFLIQFSKLV